MRQQTDNWCFGQLSETTMTGIRLQQTLPEDRTQAADVV